MRTFSQRVLAKTFIAGALAALTLMPQTAQAALAWPGARSRDVQIVITDHGFVPDHILALVNQPLHIHVVNHGSKVHQFSIAQYYIYTEDLQPRTSSEIGFTPNLAGRFQMMSDPTGNNAPEFVGWMTVTDQK